MFKFIFMQNIHWAEYIWFAELYFAGENKINVIRKF